MLTIRSGLNLRESEQTTIADTVALQGDKVWTVTSEMASLGELTRMEIAKHIWDSRHDSLVTGFEYARKRGTRNMLLPTPPLLDAPRGTSRVAAAWDVESLQVEVTCQGRDEGDDRIVVLLAADGAAPLKFQCGPDGALRMREGHLAGDRVPDEIDGADERRILRDSLVDNMLAYYLWSMETNPLGLKGEIGNNTANEDHKAVLVALALRDEVLDAEEVLDAARADIQTPIRAIPPDGSWPESVNYWGVFSHPIVTYAQALETAMGTDDGVFSLPGIRNAGYFPIYFTPRGVPAGFGDAGWAAAASPFLHLLARRFDKPLFSLYADAYGGTSIDEYNYYRHSDWYTLLWRSPEYEYLDAVLPTEVGDLPPPPALAAHMELDTFKVYEEIRWAAIASSWPLPELYVSFKSGYAIRGFRTHLRGFERHP